MNKEKTPVNVRALLSEAAALLLGSAIYGLAIAFFIGPSGTIMGGATGIATTINILFPQLTIGSMILVINIPIILFGLKIYGWRVLWRVVVAVLMTSTMSNLFELFHMSMTDDPLLAAIMGGLLLGVGAGMMMSRGYNTGGSDLAGVMLKQKLIKSLSTGRIIFIIDLFVIGGSALITKSFNIVFYSVISIYAYTFAVDYIIDGNKSAKMSFIISDQSDEISKAIAEELDRGVTLLRGEGWYSHTDKNVILCVVKPHELYRVKATVKRVDPKAFMILTDAKEVLGEGFAAEEL